MSHLVLVFLLAGCGYVGDPRPPALKTPVAVRDLKAWQRGATVVLEFTVPDRTTEGLPLPRIGRVEIRAGAALLPEARVTAPGPAHVETSAARWVGQEIVFVVRVANVNGRFSDWSNPVALPVVAPLARPGPLVAEAVPEGVRLRWSAPDRPGQAFRVWRRAGKQEQPEIVARPGSLEWTDAATEYGTAYEYSVQATLKTGAAEAESEPSDMAAIVPRDVFPPATPRDLTVIAGAGTVELGWERNTEADFAGYRVYRSLDGGPLVRVAELIETPSYSDRDVRAGAKYAYTVTAVDRAGNESPRPAPVEVEFR